VISEHYEKTNFPIDNTDPIELLEYVMESRGLTRKDFEPAIGPRVRVGEILDRTRPLSLAMIRRLVDQFDLPADVLVKPYALRDLISCETR
jgi:HTH-type transcriptional regulator/antitoxin HigA